MAVTAVRPTIFSTIIETFLHNPQNHFENQSRMPYRVSTGTRTVATLSDL